MKMFAPRLLLTGFGPFPGVPDNPSARLVEMLAASEDAPETLILPVDWMDAAARLDEALERVSPEIVLMFGVSRRATSFRIERFAFNRIVPRPDAEEFIPRGGPVGAGYPARLETALPAQALARSLRAGGWSAATSRSAGRYLCNLGYLHALNWAAHHPARPLVGFIHIPVPSEADGAMSMARLAAGASRIVSFARDCYGRRFAEPMTEEAIPCWTGAG